MPEDYQAILNDLGVDTSNTAAPNTGTADNGNTPNNVATENNANTANNTGTTPVADPTNDANSSDNNASNNTNNQNVNNSVPDNNTNQRAQEAFAALRSENSKYKKFMANLMKGSNFSGTEEDFMNKLSEAAYQRQAQINNVSPEMLKRMDTIENQNKALIDAQNRQLFAANIKHLQDTFKLNDKEINEFISLAAREKIDLTIPGSNFVTLYQGLFFDSLKDKIINEERQKWIAQGNKANNAANPDGKSGKKDPTPTDVKTMAEFESLLQSMPTDKK